MDICLFLEVVGCIAFCLYWYLWPKYLNLPPEPVLSLPLFGHILHLRLPGRGREEDVVLRWYKEKQLPLMTVRFGPVPVVIVNSLDLIKEVLVKRGEEFSFRPKQTWTFDFTGDLQGVLKASGPLWEEQRKFSTKALRMLGVGKTQMEDKLGAEIEKVLGWFANAIREAPVGGKALVDPTPALRRYAVNVISSLLFGHTYELGDVEFESMMRTIDELLLLIVSNRVFVLQEFTFLRFLPVLNGFGYWSLVRCQGAVKAFARRIIDEHRRRLHGESEPSDFVDAYLQEMRRLKREGMDDRYFLEKHLVGTLSDIWIAGHQSSTATLRWSLLYMILNPKVQTKMRDEILRVVGRNRRVTLADHSSLPYANACLMEIQRMCNVVVATDMHCANEDTRLGGYTIPKGLMIFPHLYSINMDPDEFEDPTTFRPERFIDPVTQDVKKAANLIPFGAGKRVCLGENLAKTELFLVLAELIRGYKFGLVEGEPKPSVEPIRSLALFPHDYRCEVSFAGQELTDANIVSDACEKF